MQKFVFLLARSDCAAMTASASSVRHLHRRAALPSCTRVLLPLLALTAVPTATAEVFCGGHHAEDCAGCPQGNGASWCNGECKWAGNKCLTQNEADLYLSSGPFPRPPDTRPPGCLAENEYDLSQFENLTVSVVLPWLKESWIHLKHTLEAMLEHTPPSLIKEFIFVSDGNEDSKEKELKEISSKVRVLALKERHGLIRAKMKGVDIAKAPVIVFMEGHCIVNRGWLQPLLQRLVKNPRTLAMPGLDVIPQDNWYAYHKSGDVAWRYEWNLNLHTTHLGAGVSGGHQPHEPFMTPGTSGGIFAMSKEWFQHLKLFDEGMFEWGGDHFELTMKVWRCGGRIEIVPCSRIGHLFRDPQHRPYDVDVDQVVANYQRLASVWLPEYMEHFYRMKPEARRMKLANMDKVIQEHKELNCKSMDWYLQNVDVEMNWEKDKICHPYVRTKDRCKGELPPGRFTVTKADLMPKKEFEKARRAADIRLRAEAEAEAYGHDVGDRKSEL